MKQFLLGITLILGTISINAQETDNQRKNDVLADPVLLIAVPMANVSYERLLSENKGLGINAMITLDPEDERFTQFSAFYRMYFGKKYASGFFLEGFIPVTTVSDDIYSYNYDDITQNYYTSSLHRENFTTVGIGFGIGGKWVMKNNLVIEASGGIARRFGDRDKHYFEEVTGKVMGGIGYRF
ncbi:hypothetical protein K0U91_05620 [Chryseobacterium chendengshani]|uniref:hypothetical protein n=1 Tax=Chryseobacterium sp. LJ668 TaxID=2864040 RepID=UPI001C6886F4|nr:hypothetical protein [Chryseobacterium sp. LJ668]MBW8521947.1 hypothetical protein [Chryseobacterium sp. LJ668]QYK17602.1 hypothetical protein K0U91_05620 [Chryseobacterium sp. LJ668]